MLYQLSYVREACIVAAFSHRALGLHAVFRRRRIQHGEQDWLRNYRRCITGPTPSAALEGSDILRHPLVRELVGARLVCVLATFDELAIHAVPMWFAHDGDALVLATGSSSRKMRNLERDQRGTVVLHDSRPGFEVCGVSMTGRVEIVRGEQASRLVQLVHGRYVAAGAELTPEVDEFLRSDDAALRFHPLTALTWDERGSAANTALRSLGGGLPLVSTRPRAEAAR